MTEVVFDCGAGRELTEEEISARPAPEPIGIELARFAMWQTVKAIRDGRENDVAPTPIGLVQCDDRSKLKISGMVQMAMIAQAAGQPFAEDFTMADNSVQQLSAAQAIEMGIAVGSYVSALHARARVLRADIEGAADQAALDAIDISAGWPAITPEEVL